MSSEQTKTTANTQMRNNQKRFNKNQSNGKRGGFKGGRGGRGRGGKKQFNGRRSIKDNRTIYIGKVFTRDLEGNGNLTQKLIDQRIQLLIDYLNTLGKVENIYREDGYMLATYSTHEEAVKALQTLKNRDSRDKAMIAMKDKLKNKNFPESTCPNMAHYSYNWSDKQVKTQKPKTAYVNTGITQPTTKNVVANGEAKQTKKKEKKKSKKEEKTETAPQTKPVKAPVDAEDLRREAEKAKLKDELTYLSQQQNQIRSEVNAEKTRVAARTERIAKLSEELERVELEKQRIARKLSAEQQWKKIGEERIAKLEEELNHIIADFQHAEQRLLATQHPEFANGQTTTNWAEESINQL